ncbi:MAG: hypothetical protein VX498_11695 [Myxococcota bacterium]|nr:hypothetical protein [Myxococcota bacterium]
MSNLASFDASDLKLIYRTLHGALTENLDLMDSDFLSELQTWLRNVAASEGVDTSDHAQWDAWLGGKPVACEERLAGRRKLTLV